jgi:hypothetical protein
VVRGGGGGEGAGAVGDLQGKELIRSRARESERESNRHAETEVVCASECEAAREGLRVCELRGGTSPHIGDPHNRLHPHRAELRKLCADRVQMCYSQRHRPPIGGSPPLPDQLIQVDWCEAESGAFHSPSFVLCGGGDRTPVEQSPLRVRDDLRGGEGGGGGM